MIAESLPDGLIKTDEFLSALDRCWLVGFAHLSSEHRQALNKLQHIFSETPLAAQLTTAIESIYKGLYQPEHFRVLAVARAALQGAQYDHLRRTIESQLKRQQITVTVEDSLQLAPAAPLVNGAAHWLMDIAIQGFARLEPGELSAFDSTLHQLQNDPDMMPLTAMLNGLMDDLIGTVPVAASESAPLFRWVDLWTQTLLMTTYQPALHTSQPTSGVLHLMGVEWRSQTRIISLTFHGILIEENKTRWVRATFSAYKVNAIQRDEAWLLLPQVQRLLHAMQAGETFQLEGMSLLPTGDLLWNDEQATMGAPYKLMGVAERYLIPGAERVIDIPPLPPEKRHPVHLMIPIALKGYQIDGETITAGDLRLPIDLRRIHNTEISLMELPRYDHLVGLLRYDHHQLWLQPLSAANKRGQVAFIGNNEGLSLFKKPPKNNTVEILQERASRLLREK